MKIKIKLLLQIIGLFVIIVALCLLSIFSFKILTGVRAYVGGEGIWAKQQKEANFFLLNYIYTENPAYYKNFLKYLEVTLGDKQARLELDKQHPQIDLVVQGFQKGKNHIEDIPSMIFLYRLFRTNPDIDNAIKQWQKGDFYIEKLILFGKKVNQKIKSQKITQEDKKSFVRDLISIQTELSKAEDGFSFYMNKASRYVYKIVFWAMLTFTAIGITIIFFLSFHIFKIFSNLLSAKKEIEQFKLAIEMSSDAIGMSTPEGKHYYQNHTFDSIFGNAGENPSSTIFVEETIGIEVFRTIMNGKSWTGEVKMLGKDKNILDIHLRAYPIVDKMNNILGLVGIHTDITKIKSIQEELFIANKKLEQLAFTDALTGAINRYPLIKILDNAIMTAKRKNEKIALLFLDLEKFKALNDTYGHEFGDQALIATVKKIRQNLRQTDILGRYGGDEFLVGLKDIKSAKNALKVAKKINDSFNEKNIINGIKADLSVSIGISIYPDDCDNLTSLIQYSDLAMYKAKEKRKNTSQLYNDKFKDELELELALLHGLSNNEFRLYYQPIVDNKGKCISVEALLRWKNSFYDEISPSYFIPILEKNKSIIEVGNWVISEAVKQINSINKSRKTFSDISVSINLSSRQVEDKGFISEFTNMLDSNNNLIFEITEENKIRDMKSFISKLNHIKEISNCSIALDDYGSGYSSFNNVMTLPIDIVKLDKQMITNLCTKDLKNTILGVINLFKKMNLQIIAEGIETQEQFDILKDSGCDYFQGYYFCRPTPNILELLKEGNRYFPMHRRNKNDQS